MHWPQFWEVLQGATVRCVFGDQMTLEGFICVSDDPPLSVSLRVSRLTSSAVDNESVGQSAKRTAGK